MSQSALLSVLRRLYRAVTIINLLINGTSDLPYCNTSVNLALKSTLPQCQLNVPMDYIVLRAVLTDSLTIVTVVSSTCGAI